MDTGKASGGRGPGLLKPLLLIGAGLLSFLLLRHGASALPGAALPAVLLRGVLDLWLPWLLLYPLALWLCRHYPLEGARRVRRFLLHLFCLPLLAGLHASLVVLRLALGGPDYAELGAAPRQGATSLLFDQDILLLDALVYLAILARETGRRLRQEVGKFQEDAFRLNRHLSASRLQTLKMQLNPHFLFNSLNSVSVLVEKGDNALAQSMIAELAAFLRRSLSTSQEKWHSLEQELTLVRGYLAIEQIRFGKRLDYHEECEALALNAKVPPLLLQPLFENAIVHGLADKQGACRLSFECRLVDRRLHILISDNGEGFDLADPRHGSGIGLANVRARLREIYAEHYALVLEPNPAGGTLVDLRIPAYKDSHF